MRLQGAYTLHLRYIAQVFPCAVTPRHFVPLRGTSRREKKQSNETMKVSVITASFNSAATLSGTMETVLMQTYPDIEYIVIDGASTDGTVDVIKQYEPRFKGRLRWISEKDNGIYDAMNKGLAMATGDIVGVLNSDDLYYDERVVADIVETFEKNDVESIYGDLVFVEANNTNHIVRTWKGSQHTPGAFLRGWHPAHPT